MESGTLGANPCQISSFQKKKTRGRNRLLMPHGYVLEHKDSIGLRLRCCSLQCFILDEVLYHVVNNLGQCHPGWQSHPVLR